MIIQELSGIHRELGLISLCVKFRNGNIATGQVLDTVQDQDKGLRQWCVCVCVCVYVFSCSVLSTSLRPYGLQPSRLLCPWSFPGKNTRVGCHFLFQGIFQTQGSNPHLLNWQADSLPLSLQGRRFSPRNTVYNSNLRGKKSTFDEQKVKKGIFKVIAKERERGDLS